MQLQDELRRLIDEAAAQNSIEPVQAFIAAHPDLNLDAITPNGLSALWWALTPPKDKAINQKLVTFLIKHTNIVQTYQDYTPRQYLELLNQDGNKTYSRLIENIKSLEDRHVVPVGNHHLHHDLGAIARDAQNVHRNGIVQDTDQSVVRLYQRYGENLNTTRTLKVVRAALPKTGRLLSFLGDNLTRALNAVETDTTARTYQLPGGTEISLTIGDILCLVWHGANEQDESLLCGAKNAGKDKQERIEAVWNALREGMGYCWVGRSSRIVHSINARHVDVHHHCKTLDPEQSRNKYHAILNQELSAVLQSDVRQFWLLVQQALLEDDASAEATCAYQAFIDALLNEKQLIKTLRDEQLDEKTIQDIRSNLNAKMLPVILHPAIRPLTRLQAIYYSQISFDENLNSMTDASPDDLVTRLIEQMPLSFIESSSREDLPDYFGAYMKRLDPHQTEMIFRRVIWLYIHTDSTDNISLKDYYVQAVGLHYLENHYPAYTAWFKVLSADQQKALMQVIAKEPDLTEATLIVFALQHRQLLHLNLHQVDLRNQDLRGMDLSDIDLSNISLENVDCRLVTTNAATKLHLAEKIAHARFSSPVLYKLFKEIQEDVARYGRGKDHNLILARELLQHRDIDLTIKDNEGISLLQRVLGQNEFGRFFNNVYCNYRPPIVNLLVHPQIVQHATAVERTVKVVRVAVALPAFTLGMLGVAVILVAKAVALTPLVVLVVSTAMIVGVKSREEIERLNRVGYHYVSSYHNPLILTNKTFERIKAAMHYWVGSGMKVLGRALIHPFKYVGQAMAAFIQSPRYTEHHGVEAAPLLNSGSTTQVYQSLKISPASTPHPVMTKPQAAECNIEPAAPLEQTHRFDHDILGKRKSGFVRACSPH